MTSASQRFIGRICSAFASLGPIGHLPAPGTCGSFAAIFLLWWGRRFAVMHGFGNLSVTLGVMIVAFWIIKGALLVLRDKDPQQIVLDEVAGFFVAMHIFPFTLVHLALTFVLFRLFDIEKPFGIGMLEDLPGAWGIMADDVAAGLMAGFVVSWVMFGLKLLGVS